MQNSEHENDYPFNQTTWRRTKAGLCLPQSLKHCLKKHIFNRLKKIKRALFSMRQNVLKATGVFADRGMTVRSRAPLPQGRKIHVLLAHHTTNAHPDRTHAPSER